MNNFKPVNSINDVPVPSGKWHNANKFKMQDHYVTVDGNIYKLLSKQERKLSFCEKLYYLTARVIEIAVKLFCTLLFLSYQNERKGFWPEKQVVFYGQLVYPTGNEIDIEPSLEENSLIFNSKEALGERALSFFQATRVDSAPVVFPPNETVPQNEQELLARLLQDHPGFVIGESHSTTSAKTFLLDNLPFLVEEKGVKVLFLEGHLIDQDPKEKMARSQNIEKLYKTIVSSYKKEYPESSFDDIPYTYQVDFARQYLYRNAFHWEIIPMQLFFAPKDVREIVTKSRVEIALLELMAVHRFKISVIPIDHSKAYKDGKFHGQWHESGMRGVTMNYIAYQSIQAELNRRPAEDKFVAFMGTYHLGPSAEEKIPGVPDLIQCPRVAIYDKKRLSFWQRISPFAQSIQKAPLCLEGTGIHVDIAVVR